VTAIVVLPGASLMQIRKLSDTTFLIRCPACGEQLTYEIERLSGLVFHGFAHKDDCSILRQIELAMAIGNGGRNESRGD
jgi:hypothetical protein